MWSSSDPAVATVDNQKTPGLVDTMSAGIAQIVAADTAGHSGTSTVTVGAQLVSVQIQPSSLSIRGGTGAFLHAIGTFSDGSTAFVGPDLHWVSSDDQVASVSNSPHKVGLVVGGRMVGTATITGSVTVAPGLTLSATAQVMVTSLLSSFKLQPQNLIVHVGGSGHVAAIGTFSDGTNNIDITKFVAFQTSDPGIATATNRPRKNGRGIGLISGISRGIAEISATSPTTGVVSADSVTVHVQ
jgi:uncharacterized protein YjdB